MTDDETNPVTEPVADAVTEPAPDGDHQKHRGRKVRRVLLTALPVVLVLGAVGGAAAYTKNTVDAADRTVTTAIWDEDHVPQGKDPAGDPSRGRHDTELAKLLLPVPKGYRLGPDIGDLGNDSETSGAKATAAMKEMGRGLAGKDRRELNKFIEKLRIQGIAKRSYLADSNDLLVNVEVVKMRDKRALHRNHADRKTLLDGVDELREGPSIEGHRKASCYRLPKGDKDSLDGVLCIAYEGEVSVSVEASGSKPFSPSEVGDLVKDQLDHIASPGEYI
ncbi:hypothetical protein LEL86_01795 [Streptomyces sp. WA6-1-16]|uniref:hypothetical protein n=1 Tax=Streptomyces sp. WA6-1-16 TaxID=2879427 RepID=UPI001CE2E43C|nr:hypothetical protein [Streptomyces sp. WA6-1-16]UCA48096.1 hypothetical protein LEL86_01795 [Streptomyces sp. WA6-1-16]